MKEKTCTLLAVVFVVISLAIYGGTRLYYRLDRLDLIESLQAENATLKNKVTWLRRTNAFSLILEQVLTPCQIDELGLLNERIRQKKITVPSSKP